MKFKILHFVIVLCCALVSFTGEAQIFSKTYDFASITTTTGRIDPSIVPTAAGVTFGSFTAVGSMGTNPNAGGRFSFQSWPTGATSGSDVFTGSINTGQYYEVTLSPQANFSLSLTSIIFTSQRSATGIRQYAVRSSIDGFANNLSASISPTNNNLKVVAGNVFQTVDVTTPVAENGSTVTFNGFTNLATPVTFRFYGWNAEGTGGTFSIDNVTFNGEATPAVGSPVLTVNAGSLTFPTTPLNASTTIAYTLKGENLSDPVSITTAAPFSVSENGTDFSTSISVPVADVAIDKTIYVKFSPAVAGTIAGTVVNTSANALTKTINVQGDAVDPAVTNFDFNTCTLSGLPAGGFLAYNVTGAQKWACSFYGRNNTHGVDINGYSGSSLENEDWLISPPVYLTQFTNMPVLSFYSRGEFSGPKLELFVSTDYDGFSAPSTATWTPLEGNFPTPPGASTTIFTLSDNINLSAYKSFPKIYLAFKYTSSPPIGAARWTLDDIAITNQTNIFSVTPVSLNFGEVAPGATSSAQPVILQVIGGGDITLSAPAGYKLSLDNNAFSTSVVVPEAAASVGTTVYVQFTPSVEQLKIAGKISFTGSALNKNAVDLSGSSLLKSKTLDVACYNLSFFGSSADGPVDQSVVDLRVANITTVMQRMNVDIVGVEEISTSSALQALKNNLPGYDTVISQRWSYSFNPPDPIFPPQKVGFIYNTNTMHLVEQRVMFEKLYDDARNGLSNALDDYPTGSPSSFWSSGRLPFMATFDVDINGVTKRIRFIDIHAKSASGDVNGDTYNRRVYDAKVLKDTLDTYYKNDNIVFVGDYNDRIFTSIYNGQVSPYINFKNDAANYDVLTYDLDAAGLTSFPGDPGMIDHIIVSNELANNYLTNSIQIEPANTYIVDYGKATASDHLPVFARFDLSTTPLPITLTQFTATPKKQTVVLSWMTATEINNDHFVVERSVDGKSFSAIATVKGTGNSSRLINYQTIDQQPYNGKNYYRLRQVDIDGRSTLSSVVVVNFASNNFVNVYPNPVTSYIKIEGSDNGGKYSARISSVDGRVMLYTSGNLSQVNNTVNNRLSGFAPGVYILELNNCKQNLTQKFMKR
ncbi:T9SS type A sorting domain-containing protein [Pinibacter soli]|uniref:T9SS type A sorting domain-containing protein n=1 Tax=Pinibacter soli TaxID=3044211 RepID=A0ABT6RBX6_9BACT|nr:T9SS type A sorting domain-containing protein [Pinibacter soli]MDI3320067.1 T9SS type A sorting domain-containing protein [Pinibacter soli]